MEDKNYFYSEGRMQELLTNKYNEGFKVGVYFSIKFIIGLIALACIISIGIMGV